MWSVEYVQVPDESQQKTNETTPTKDTISQAANKLVKETSQPVEIVLRRRSSCNSYGDDVQTAVDRLKDFKDPDYIASKQVELGSSYDSNSIFMSNIEETIGSCDKGHNEGAGAIEREDSNMSQTSSLSDLGNPEEVGVHDLDLNQVHDLDGEVVSQKSEVSVASAMDALEMPENFVSDKGGTSQSVVAEAGKSVDDVKTKISETDGDLKSPSSEFEVISEAEVKNTSNQTAEDVVRKYRRKTKNTLREGKYSGLQIRVCS